MDIIENALYTLEGYGRFSRIYIAPNSTRGYKIMLIMYTEPITYNHFDADTENIAYYCVYTREDWTLAQSIISAKARVRADIIWEHGIFLE